VKEVGGLVTRLPTDDTKNQVTQQLATFIDQAKKESPSRSLLSVTEDGLIEAAKTVAEMVPAVTSVVTAVKALLGIDTGS
jgi:hypothetical protein